MQTMIVFEVIFFNHSIAELNVLRVLIFCHQFKNMQLFSLHSDCKHVNLSELSAPKMFCLGKLLDLYQHDENAWLKDGIK